MVRAIANDAEDQGSLSAQLFKKLRLFTLLEMNNQVSLELGKMKAVRKRNGTPPQLHRCRYKLAL